MTFRLVILTALWAVFSGAVMASADNDRAMQFELPAELAELLTFREGSRGDMVPREVCRSSEYSEEDYFGQVEGVFRCLQRLANVTHTLAGHPKVPQASFANEKFQRHLNSLRGARYFQVRQDSALMALESYQIDISTPNSARLTRVVIEATPETHRDKDAVLQICHSSRDLDAGLLRVIARNAPLPSMTAPVTSNEGVCVGGGLSFLEVASLGFRKDANGQRPIKVGEYMRTCGQDDSAARMTRMMEDLFFADKGRCTPLSEAVFPLEKAQ